MTAGSLVCVCVGGGATKKRTKNSKKDQKIALLCLFQGGGWQRKKERKTAKNTEK